MITTHPSPFLLVDRPTGTNPWLVQIAYAMVIGIFAADLLLPAGITPGVLYVAPVLLMLSLPPQRQPFGIAALCTPLLLAGFLWSPPGSGMWIDAINHILILGAVWITALLSTRRQELERALRRSHDDLERQIQGRTAELMAANTSLQTAEQKLARERDLLKVTLASIGDAVIVTDLAANLTFMNSVAESWTQWPLHKAIGNSIANVMPLCDEETQRTIDNPVTRVLQEEIGVELTNHMLLMTRDGHEIPITSSVAPIRDQDRRVYGVVMVFHDVSTQQQAEVALQRARAAAEAADRTKSEFLASISYELRTPLNVIL